MHHSRILHLALAAFAGVVLCDLRICASEPEPSRTTPVSLPIVPIPSQAPPAPPLTDVDVLVLYTSAARDGAGGTAPLKAAILAGFDEANQIHSNSLTQVRLNPVAMVETSYRETGSIRTDFPAVIESTSALRRDYRADLVIFVYETDKFETSGGTAGAPGENGNPSAAYAAIQRTRPWGLGEGIANRTGRLLGCGQIRPDVGSLPHSAAHLFVADGIEVGTIMSGHAGIIPYFSNPNVLYRGQPTGIADDADNAASLREMAPKVAEYEKCTNRVEFELAATRVNEPEATVRLLLLRTGPSDTTARLRAYPVNGTARVGRDYNFSSQFVDFAVGEMEKSLEITLLDDALTQGPRSFQVRLDTAAPGTGIGMNGILDVTIEDDDTPFRMASDAGFVIEGGEGTAVHVTRTKEIESAASISLGAVPPASNDSLIASLGDGAPLVALPVMLHFSPGEAEVSVRLLAADDTGSRPDEAVMLGLEGPGLEGNPSTTLTLWVRDNDRPSLMTGGRAVHLAAGPIEGPVLPLPDGSFLACRRPEPGAAIRLGRYRSDGSLDPSWTVTRFQESLGLDAGLQFGRVHRIVRAADGKILVAGQFAVVNEAIRRCLVRLLPNGGVDPAFHIGDGFDGSVDGLCEQPDGAIVAVGSFTRVDGVRRNSAARLMPDGGLDDGFQPDFAGDLTAVAMQGDKILVSGPFERVGTHQAANIARLHPDGTADTSFRSILDGVATGFRVLPGGAFYAYGPFLAPTRWAGLFEANGSRNTRHRFQGLNGTVLDVLPIAGGESLVSGRFAGTATSQPLFVRFHADGTADRLFGPRFDTPGSVRAMLAGPSGGLTLIGNMTEVGGSEPSNVIRLGSGAWSTELMMPRVDGGSMSVEAQTIPGLTHRLERSSDMARWDVVDSLDATASSAWFRDPSPSAASFYRVRVGQAEPPTP